MRYTLAAICLLIFACSTIIPDYDANKIINKPIRGPVTVYTNNYGPTCTDGKGNEGKPALSMLVSVFLKEMAPIVIEVNGHWATFPVGLEAHLRYNAGVGHHRIEIKVPDHEPIVKTVTVYNCEERK